MTERKKVNNAPQAIIIEPSRELADQTLNQLHQFQSKLPHQPSVTSLLVVGGVPAREQIAALKAGVDIVVATPGRLLDFVQQGKIGFHRVQYLVLDEADKMLDMGFMPDVKKIVGNPHMPPKGQRQTLMFSATFPEAIRNVAKEFLNNYLFLRFCLEQFNGQY